MDIPFWSILEQVSKYVPSEYQEFYADISVDGESESETEQLMAQPRITYNYIATTTYTPYFIPTLYVLTFCIV